MNGRCLSICVSLWMISATLVLGATAIPSAHAGCTVNLGDCSDGNCTVNADNCRGNCVVNLENCGGTCIVNAKRVIANSNCGGQCEINYDHCGSDCDTTVNGAACHSGTCIVAPVPVFTPCTSGTCEVNLGFCYGDCTVNVVFCSPGAECTVSAGACVAGDV